MTSTNLLRLYLFVISNYTLQRELKILESMLYMFFLKNKRTIFVKYVLTFVVSKHFYFSENFTF